MIMDDVETHFPYVWVIYNPIRHDKDVFLWDRCDIPHQIRSICVKSFS